MQITRKNNFNEALNMLRISLILCLFLILFSCSQKEKLYKTTVVPEGLQMLSTVDWQREKILKIPYKSKVELVDKKNIIFLIVRQNIVK